MTTYIESGSKNIYDIKDIKKNKKFCFLYRQYFILKYKNLRNRIKRAKEKTNEEK